MKKVPKNYENVFQIPEVKKHSQSVYFEVENESVSLVQIGENIKVVSPLVFS